MAPPDFFFFIAKKKKVWNQATRHNNANCRKLCYRLAHVSNSSASVQTRRAQPYLTVDNLSVTAYPTLDYGRAPTGQTDNDAGSDNVWPPKHCLLFHVFALRGNPT